MHSASARFTHYSVSQTLSQLRTPSLESGLAARDVPDARAAAGGPNEFAVKGGEEPWRKFLGQFQEPLILLLLGSAAVSLLIGQVDDAVSITLAIVIVITGECACPIGPWGKDEQNEPSFVACPGTLRRHALPGYALHASAFREGWIVPRQKE